MMTVFFLVLCTILVYAVPPPPQCAVYCTGNILDKIQQAGIFTDSKTFVDMPMKNDPEVVIQAFNNLPNYTKPMLNQFLNEQFDSAGSELLSWVPPDWVERPEFVDKINSARYQDFAVEVNLMWKSLGKQLVPDVLANPQRYSILPLRHPFMVPGQRFREFYYWDSFWIIKGLMACDMATTAKGIILNGLEFVQKYGFVPNGARVYYLTRSQPPLLSEMVRFYYEQTQDIDLLRQAVVALDIEYTYWMTTQSITLADGSILNRFYSSISKPRPESYREDTANAAGMSESDARHFYANTIAGAESGEDFSTKWFTSGANLLSIDTSDFIPVGLNSILFKFEANMVYFYDTLDMEPPVDYAQAMESRRKAMDTYLWNPSANQWYDFCISNGSQIMRAYPSNWLPIWAGAYCPTKRTELYTSLVSSGLIQPGGVLTTLIQSGQQWDSPNAWAPYQSFIVDILAELGSSQSLSLAKTVAIRWINATYLGYQSTHMMHEKYNAFIPGAPGSGGEYPPQIGFGWTNGVTLDFMRYWLTPATQKKRNSNF